MPDLITFPARIEQFRHWLRMRDKRELTVHAYCVDMDLFRRFTLTVYNVEPDIVTAQDVQAWRQEMLAQHLTARSINRRLTAIKMYCRWQAAVGLASDDAVRGVAKLRTSPQPLPPIPSRVETLRFLRVINRHTWKGARDYAIVQLFIQAGLRGAEVANICLGDYKLEPRSGMLRIRQGKGAKERMVPLNATARNALVAWLDVRPAEPPCESLWLRAPGEALQLRTIQGRVKTHMKRAGIKGSAHTLRHLFATNLYELTHDLALVGHVLGHTSVVTTQRYTHVKQEAIDEAAEALPTNIAIDEDKT